MKVVINKCTEQSREYIWQSLTQSGHLEVALIGIYILCVLLIVDHIKRSGIVLIRVEVIWCTATGRRRCARTTRVRCKEWNRECTWWCTRWCQCSHVITESTRSGRLIWWRGGRIIHCLLLTAWIVQLSLTVVMGARWANIVTRIRARALFNLGNLFCLGEYGAGWGRVRVGWILGRIDALGLLIVKWCVQQGWGHLWQIVWV